ncbi:Panacea domain-containing protein [Mycolicibacterium porcinum]|uniref:Type II toxin-antitoxin system antitoxin SocA domain-containing protein n=1 Tax=Mycolicibacterium porcinum TaxID=39693 RepID=A0ABV3V9V4_9MYCO
MATANDVAAYIMEQYGKTMTTMKLQKLLYYSQGWSLAWDGQPMFEDEIAAWANGPVVYSVFDNHRGKFKIGSWRHGDATTLTEDERETVNAVLGYYGKLTGQELSDMTHAERPWLEARGNLPVGAYSSQPIDLDVMQDFFGDLASQQ